MNTEKQMCTTTSGANWSYFTWFNFTVLWRHINDCIASPLIKFCKIPWKCGNSTARGKFRFSARNSVTCGKLWALLITCLHCLPRCINTISQPLHIGLSSMSSHITSIYHSFHNWQLEECLYHSSHLNWPHLISAECALISRRPRQTGSCAATNHSTLFRWNEVRSDEWYEWL